MKSAASQVRSSKPLRVAMLTVDGRELRGGGAEPVYGSAVSSLLEGFRDLLAKGAALQLDVISFAGVPEAVCKEEACGIRHWSLPIPRIAQARAGYLGRIFAVRRWLKMHPVELVHAQGTERWCGWVAGWCGRPYVLSIHGHVTGLRRRLRPEPAGYWLLHEWFERWAVRRAEVVNSLTKAVGVALAGQAKRVVSIPNAAGKRFFAIQRAPEFPPIVLQIGDLLPGKRPLEMLHALDNIHPKEFRMVFIGYAPPGAEYARRLQAAMAVRPWAEWILPGGPELVADWLAKATALVHPSLAENCPMVVLEAVAAGVPVFATNVGGVAEIIDQEAADWLVPTNDLDGLAAKLESRLMGSAKVRMGSEHGAMQGRSRFSPQAIAGCHFELYQAARKEADG